MIQPFLGFGRRRSSETPAAIEYRSSSRSASDLTTYTFTAMDVGTAASDRYVVVCVNGGTAAALARTVSSLTVGGVSATQVAFFEDTGAVVRHQVGIFIVALPTGTTADVVVTWSGAASLSGIDVFKVTGLLSSTATATQTSGADPGSVTISCSAGGIIICASGTYTGSATTYTWTNLTERVDTAYGSPDAAHTLSSASDAFATAQTSLVITADPSVTADAISTVAAAFR